MEVNFCRAHIAEIAADPVGSRTIGSVPGDDASHPLGGCRMAASPDLGVVDHRGAVFGYEGLYCMDSSIVPTSWTVGSSSG